MGFSFHPPTRTECSECERLETRVEPIITTSKGKASAADNFEVHNWFNFVLGYTPEFPEYVIKNNEVGDDSLIVDPFSGSGTTLVYSKSVGIPSLGIEANDYFCFAANTKLNWTISSTTIRRILDEVELEYFKRHSNISWGDSEGILNERGIEPFDAFASRLRPEMLDERYISNHSFAQFQILKEVLSEVSWSSKKSENLFNLALSSILVACSNIRYGPGFGISKKVKVVNVFEVFRAKILRMATDLASENIKASKKVPAAVLLGDARNMSSYIGKNSVDLMITSPPYPGDHEYTKHSRLELIFGEYAESLAEFRDIKKRMLRGSTTNIYKDDHEGENVLSIESIRSVTDEIANRLEADGATSGFEKLYCKLIWEYFGGMYSVFIEAKKVLKPGGRFSLLVSDSHAFKMVHICTAEILSEVAKLAGFDNSEIELWQLKTSTSHKYQLFENILTVW